MSLRFRRFNSVLASLRMAVIIILALAVIAAVGTITEAVYNDSEVATQRVYQSFWMYLVLGLLIVNLVAVMVDRWPWKQRHAGFVLAHIGIITLLFGAWVTKYYGVDGNMAFAIGESRRVVTVKERGMVIYASHGDGYRSVFNESAEFIRHPPTQEKPYVIPLGKNELKIVDFKPFAFREVDILPSESKKDGAAVRFQIENPYVNMTQWIRLEGHRPDGVADLGPARIVLLKDQKPKPSGRNEVILVVHEGSSELDYAIYNKDQSLKKRGKIRQSETIETGWMGMKFRLLRFLPHAIEKVHFDSISYSTPMTTSAVRLLTGDKEYWLGLDVPQTFELDDQYYTAVYAHRQITLPFSLKLLDFRMGKYEGTDRASSYESEVEVPERGRVVISMNEPLKHGGYTFYQSSFERNERGEPTISVLSVNYDPGRWIKYLGSFLIVLGSIILFYFKNVKWVQHRSSP